MNAIPIDCLPEQASLRLGLMPFHRGGALPAQQDSGLHRDDHYVFFWYEQGTAAMRVDFEELAFGAGQLYYVLPGQVHQCLHREHAQGWYLGADALLIPSEFRAIFEDAAGLQRPLCLPPALFGQCRALLRLLHERSGGATPATFHRAVTSSLLHALVGIVAGGYGSQAGSAFAGSRPKQLAHQFRRLLAANFRAVKSPAAYAE